MNTLAWSWPPFVFKGYRLTMLRKLTVILTLLSPLPVIGPSKHKKYIESGYRNTTGTDCMKIFNLLIERKPCRVYDLGFVLTRFSRMNFGKIRVPLESVYSKVKMLMARGLIARDVLATVLHRWDWIFNKVFVEFI